ncbi:uncharacterized protein LOC119391356 [Rhipicephalus sanguineus]|uniref:uncharacterized protein LOC119391356 n=1 Tax=Rhipicephalus sanguineus TaxID=34632 RepID=UPI0020C466BC|nr:uncharacterized protein LOC119391356 [Rhipicephalus sanguineus]
MATGRPIVDARNHGHLAAHRNRHLAYCRHGEAHLGSMMPSWLLETALLGNMDTRVHPAWCLVALMAATALVCEVDSGVARPSLVYKLIHLSERFKLHPLYFVLPVVMQSRCVMLVPYTSTPLVFLHLYAPIRSAELYWLGLLLKVIFGVAFIIAANTMLFV